MAFLFLCAVSLVALGIGSLGVGSAYFWIVLALLGGIIFWRQKHIFTLFLLVGICGNIFWSLGHSKYEEQIEEWRILSILTDAFTKKGIVVGTLDDLAYTSDFTSTYRLIIDTFDTLSTGESDYKPGILVEIPKNLTHNVGDTISFTAKILPLLESPFDGFERYVWKSAVYGKASVPTFSLISHGRSSFLEGVQTRSRDIIFKGFPQSVASIILGMTIGDTELLTKDIKNTFILSGMSHILVVSGSNIAFVIFFLLFFLKYFRLHTFGRLSWVMGFVVLYGCLVGWDAPVIRAASMGIIAYFGMQYGKRISSISLLFLVALILATLSPLTLLFDAGFGLSFCATLGILLFHERIEAWLLAYRIPRFFIPFISITLGATLGSLPVTLYHFGTLSIGGLLANILIALVLSWILFVSVIYLILAFLGVPWLYFLGLIIYLPAKYILAVALFFSHGLHIEIPPVYTTLISLGLIGYFIVEIFAREYGALTLKVQTGKPHQVGGPKKG